MRGSAGTTVSTVNVTSTGADSLPTSSFATTVTVCEPSGSGSFPPQVQVFAVTVAVQSVWVPSLTTTVRTSSSATVPEYFGLRLLMNEPAAGVLMTGPGGGVAS